MYYKRNEPFRFEFNQPIQGTLKKLHEQDTVTIDVLLLDVSIHGAKIKCKKDIDLQKNTDINLSFSISSLSFHTLGTVSWTKQYGQLIEIGLRLNPDESYQKSIVAVLKDLAKTRLSEAE